MLTNPPNSQPPIDPDDHSAALLAAVFSKVSQSISGPNRLALNPADLADETQSFIDIDSLDPDFWSADIGDPYDFGPQLDPMLSSLPTDVLTSGEFNLDALPDATSGDFYRSSNGRLVFSRGVGEAPDNKANANLPIYQARARFMTQAYQFVKANFDVKGSGQHRDHDAPVTANRSANSDHYSDGAFDVTASSTAEAQRVLAWASTQPWVSFAQIYPGTTLVHVSANIGAFGPSATGATLPSRPGVPTQTKTPTPTAAPAIDTSSVRPVANPGARGPQ